MRRTLTNNSIRREAAGETTVKEHKRKKYVTNPDNLPENIEAEVIDKDLSETERICNQCGGELTEIDVDVDPKVKLVPAKFNIAETRTHSYKCFECDKNNAGGSQRTGTESAEQSYMWLYRTGSQHI
ncbi:MAG: IS66 family transposase zinc-finger binding domain-containing protein [Anaerolineaceae bacterium]|nr:IS66 family transposase zinc-finger binding domain-containing protein [Anaerolineaceae bacterium]